jgi:anti-sigma B factor antagonist
MATEEVPERRGGGLAITVVATSNPGEVCARLRGELDLATAPSARERIADLTANGADLVLDLRGLIFIDSTGLRLVLQLAGQSAQDGWNLSLIPGPSVVQRVFALTGTEGRLPFRGVPESQSSDRGPSAGR